MSDIVTLGLRVDGREARLTIQGVQSDPKSLAAAGKTVEQTNDRVTASLKREAAAQREAQQAVRQAAAQQQAAQRQKQRDTVNAILSARGGTAGDWLLLDISAAGVSWVAGRWQRRALVRASAGVPFRVSGPGAAVLQGVTNPATAHGSGPVRNRISAGLRISCLQSVAAWMADAAVLGAGLES